MVSLLQKLFLAGFRRTTYQVLKTRTKTVSHIEFPSLVLMAGNVHSLYLPNLLADGICRNIQFGSVGFVKTNMKLDLFFVSRYDSVHEEKLISVVNYMLVASK